MQIPDLFCLSAFIHLRIITEWGRSLEWGDHSRNHTRGRDIHIVLQTIQMKLILLCVWAEPAVLGSAKTALKLKYEIQLGNTNAIQRIGQGINLKNERNNP